jgi:GH15 family glucan-1,4-alpha-glucosidase
MPEPNRPPAAGPKFPPIADYGFLSDCETAALVAADGAVEWLCVPRFDSPSVFAALLDRNGGALRFGPRRVRAPIGRRYLPGTNVIESDWMGEQGWLVVRDALVVEQDPENPSDCIARRMLVRVATCVEGVANLLLVCEPAFDYGRARPRWESLHDGSAEARADGAYLRLDTDLELELDGALARGERALRAGETFFCSLSWDDGAGPPTDAAEASAIVEQSADFWRRWVTEGRFPDHEWTAYLQRSALVLKGLTHKPTGALVAAATTSLPETPGGERNWDYRFSWIRDATFALWALHISGFDHEATEFMRFVGRMLSGLGPESQIMFGIGGETDLTEQTLDHLSGYGGARPVRIGNGAYSQRQNDVYGALLDAAYVHSKTREGLPEELWPLVREQVEGAMQVWREPDQGIWEARGEPQHYVSSKLMCWVAFDRGARLARRYGEDGHAERWTQEAEAVRAEVLTHGVSERGVLRQHYATDALDASTLLVPLFRFLPPDDERVRATTVAIADELTDNGLVLRYRPDETDDGLGGAREGTFLICSFWLVSALSEIGAHHDARALCRRLLGAAGPLGLYAEELDAASEMHLGNFPQAFTHLALINAVSHVIADEHAGERGDARSAVFTEMRERVGG